MTTVKVVFHFKQYIYKNLVFLIIIYIFLYCYINYLKKLNHIKNINLNNLVLRFMF